MKTSSKEKLIGPSLKRFVVTCILLGFLVLPTMVMYREMKQPAVVSADQEDSDAQGNVVNAEKLMSLRCDGILFLPTVPVRGVENIMLYDPLHRCTGVCIDLCIIGTRSPLIAAMERSVIHSSGPFT